VAAPVTSGSAAAAALPATAEPGSVPYAERADVQAWIGDVAQRTNLPTEWLQAAFAEARYQPNAARFILPAPAGTPKNWAAYRARFVEPRRIKAGVAFWNDNEAWLRQAQREYGVPPEIIVGLLGVETIYGRDMGRFRILDALVTLGFDFPANAPRDRSAYFRNELEQYYLLCRDIHANPLEINSSYAGALGLPQFMPSSWRKYAVDFDGDGRIDLIHSSADAIGSVAHYLAEFGWTRDMPNYYSVRALPAPGADLTRLLAPDIVPSFTPEEMQQLGAKLSPQGLQHEGLLALVKLENGADMPTYVAGTDNFYAITRYNQSSPYAMAVIELGKAIAQAR
jgi:membrane-bound lytic murein transglycosylase B